MLDVKMRSKKGEPREKESFDMMGVCFVRTSIEHWGGGEVRREN